MDSLKGPFTYEALPPKDIKFVPLNQTQEMNGEELMEFYEVWGLSIVVSLNPPN
jgi:phenylalanyl-tRNA synthetase beta chain